MASYHRILKVFGRSIEDKALQCDCDIHPWELLVNESRWSGRIRLIGFIDVFFLISYSENSRFHDGIIIYKDDRHIEEILSLAGQVLESGIMVPKSSPEPTSNGTPIPTPKSDKTTKNITFSRDAVDYTITGIGHPVGLRTKYNRSSLKQFTIQLRKPQDPLQKQKYKMALKQHDTLDMIQDAMKLGLVSYAEILGHGMGYLRNGTSILDMEKSFVGGLGANRQSGIGLSGDRS